MAKKRKPIVNKRKRSPKRGRRGETRRRARRAKPAQPPRAVVEPSPRYNRLYPGDRSDQRNEFQRDRDRLLYCSALRRLAEITQVVSAAEGHSFHNRLTHTLKVAQLSRRLAEKLTEEQPDVVKEIGGLDAEVAEAAALAHDLGHPPFGHIAEEALKELAEEAGEEDGFEGNAQSFRIVTRLAVRTDQYEGLNLTAATLNGMLKYPWLRRDKGKHKVKWGAYPSELDVFTRVRSDLKMSDGQRGAEAELMDWADDIAYSVFDVDDFFRAGLIPLDRIFADEVERERFLTDAVQRLTKWKEPAETIKEIVQAFKELVSNFPPRIGGAYEGTIEQRAFLRKWTSQLVGRYVHGIKLRVPDKSNTRLVTIDPELKNEVEGLKQLVWYYVIDNPRLLTQQRGQREIIRQLFSFYHDQASRDRFDIFPEPFRTTLRQSKADEDGDFKTRTVIDMIANMTETQAIRLTHRLSGVSIGSIYDHL